MLGSNPSADSVASTDPGGMLWHPPIGRGTKALNPGGAGAKPPQAAPAPKLPADAGALSHNALILNENDRKSKGHKWGKNAQKWTSSGLFLS